MSNKTLMELIERIETLEKAVEELCTLGVLSRIYEPKKKRKKK